MLAMRKLIARLHEKPEAHRKAVALGVSLAITLAIFGVWASTLSSRFQGVGSVAEETQKQLQDGITPLATAKASFDTMVNNVKDLKNSVGY